MGAKQTTNSTFEVLPVDLTTYVLGVSLGLRGCKETQRLHYPLIKEDALNYSRIPNMI